MEFLLFISRLVMPIILLLFALLLLFSKKNLLDSFVAGAKEGLMCCKELLPTLLLVMCGVSMLFASGGADLLCVLFKPLLVFLGVPEQMLPTIILRPFSGSATTVVADKLFCNFGADSQIAKNACLLMGSTDTIIYTLSVYFSSANVKKTRYALASSFAVFIFSIVFCNFICSIAFS